MAPLGPYNVQFAAFYTDCMHEFQPLTSGYRIYLSYHLVHIGQGPTPEVSMHHKQILLLHRASTS